MKKQALIIGIMGVLLLIQPLSAQTWEKAKRLTWNSGNSCIPTIALDSSSNIHIVWHDETVGNAEIFFKKSTDGGTTWTTKRLTWNSGYSYIPDIAIDPSNNIHVVWQDYSPGNAEIFYKKSTDGGTTWSNNKRLTWTPILSYDPAIATDSSNNIHIVWHDRMSTDNYEIYYLNSTNGGETWTTKRLTWNPGSSGWTDITIDPSDNIHVVWDDMTPGDREIYYKKSTDGGTTWAYTKRLTWKLFKSYCSAIAADSGNYIHVVWQDWDSSNYEIHYKRSTDGGSTWDKTKRLTWNSGSSWFAAINADTSNNIHVVWYDDTPGNEEIFYKRSTNRGTSWTTKRLTWNSGNSQHPAVVTDSNNNIHVVWQDYSSGNYEIYYNKGIQ